MTREETKKAIEVMQAYVDGETIELKYKDNEHWNVNADIGWNFVDFEYRVKPEPKVRPYKNGEEFINDMMQHGPMLKHILMGHYNSISCIDKKGIYFDFAKGCIYYYEEVPKCYTWQDGTPCGIIEE